MAKEDKYSPKAPLEATLADKAAAAEDAELEAMMKAEQEKLAKEAADGAAALEAAKKSVAAVAAPPAPPARIVGDIPVVCAKEGSGRLGGRFYQYVKGQELMMHPDHAEEMAASGWVSPIRVIGV